MAGGKMYYNVEAYNKQKRQQGNRVLPEANFFAAANHVRDLFESRQLPYGVMGGLEMFCLGHRRIMPDLHIAYDDRDFARIKSKLESDQRIRLPEGMNSLFPSKILVRTGPAYEDKECIDSGVVEVNLLPPGALGTPPVGMLSSNLVLLTHKPDGKLKTYKGLNMLHLVKTLMHLCRVPDLAWDPRKDILFLCQHYSTEIKAVQAQLDQKAIRQNFLGTPFITKLSPQDQRACYQTLLGQEPPPSMTVSPPPEEDNMYSRTGVKAPGLQILVNTSRPVPIQRPVPVQRVVSELPGQSMGGRWGSYASQPARPVSQPAELPAANLPTGPIELSASPIPSNKPAAPINPPQELAGSTVHSRSRYRHSSVPQSRKLSPPNSDATKRQRPTSVDSRNAPQKAMTFNEAPYTNSMSSIPPQQQFRGRPVEMSATPYNPGQPNMQAQLGLGGDYLDPRLRAANQRPLVDNGTPDTSMNAHQGPRKPVIQQFGPTGIQSQTASQHATPADELLNHRLSPHLAEVTEKLRLVGPEGVYPPSPKRSPPAVPTQQQQAPPADVGSTTIVAELEAHIDAALNSTPLQRTPTDPASYEPSPLISTLTGPLPLQLSTQPKPADSPVSPPESYIAFSSVKFQETRVIQKPVLERTQTAPVVVVAGGLPASLTAGSSNNNSRPNSTLPVQQQPFQQQPFQQQPRLTRSSTQFFAPPPEFSTTASKYWNYSGQAQAQAQQPAQQQPQYTAYTTQPHGYPTPPHLSPAFPASSEYKPYRPILSQTSTSTSTSSIYPPAPPATIATIQAPTPIDSPVSPPMALSFQNLRDVDGKGNYQRKSTVGAVGAGAGLLVGGGEGVMVGGHGRNTSIDSVSSKGSQGSLKLAEEYQAALPGFGRGYGA